MKQQLLNNNIMEGRNRKLAGYTMMMVGPVLGVSNIVSVIYKNFYADANYFELPSIYQTQTGNFLIGFAAMSIALTGRKIAKGQIKFSDGNIFGQKLEIQ